MAIPSHETEYQHLNLKNQFMQTIDILTQSLDNHVEVTNTIVTKDLAYL